MLGIAATVFAVWFLRRRGVSWGKVAVWTVGAWLLIALLANVVA